MDLCIGEGAAVYAVGAAGIGTAAYLASPQGQRSVRATVEGLGLLINNAVEGVRALAGYPAEAAPAFGPPGSPTGANATVGTPGTPAAAPGGVQGPIQAAGPKSAEEMAADLSKQLGKNSVPYETPNARGTSI